MNTLITYHPFGELDEAQNRITRFLGGFPNRIRMGEGNGHSLMVADWSPLVDITEEDHEYLFKADLPEIKKDDVKVTVENGILCVFGERKIEKEEKKTKFHRIERSYGTFRRSFTLPQDADGTKVTADFRDGVLKVHLPKTAIAEPEAIEVKVQ
jgi:HSP20 family protein